MVLRRYALSIIALAILESGQWLKRELRFSFFIKPYSHLWFSAATLCRLLLWQFSSPASGSKQKKDILVGVFFVLPSVTDENRKGTPLNAHGILGRNEG
jgi:hypothetical protein